MSDRYPLTLHHPSAPGVTHEVTGKADETSWREAGWRVTAPDLPVGDKTEAPAPADAPHTSRADESAGADADK